MHYKYQNHVEIYVT